MTRASSSKNKNSAPALTGKQLIKLWSSLAPAAFTEKLRTVNPAGRWSVSGHRITGCCPYHDDSTPSFLVYLDRGYAKCFGCGEFVWNPVALWARVTNTDHSTALGDLKQAFNITTVSQSSINELSAWNAHQALKKRIMEICHDTMIDAIAEPKSAHPKVKAAVDWLIGTRKLPLSAIPTFDMLGIMPPVASIMEALDADAEKKNLQEAARVAENGGKLTLVKSSAPAAAELLKFGEEWVGSVVFRYDQAPGAISRLKMRIPSTKVSMYVGDAQDKDIGFFGVGWSRYRGMTGTENHVPGAYIVEGEFDLLTLLGAQVEAFGGPRYVAVATGGNGSASSIDDLASSLGIEEAYLVSDAPHKNGLPLLKTWLSNARELRARVFVGWGEFPGAGDPDEAVLQHGIQLVNSVLLDLKNRTRFQTPQDWVFEQAEPDLKNVEAGDVRQLVSVAGEWGRLLKDPDECDAFLDACNKAFDVPSGGVKRQIMSMEEDEPAFILRLADVLSQEFFVICQRATESDRKIVLWHKARRIVVQIGLADDTCIERELSAALGPAYQFFAERVSIPPFLDALIDKDKGPYLQRFDAACRWYYKQALVIMAQKAPEAQTAMTKGQGFHVIKDSKEGTPTLYLVNGVNVYHGQYVGGDAPQDVKWAQLVGPTHDGILFDIGLNGSREAPWLDSVRSVSDLNRATEVDPAELLGRIERILELGWRFKHQSVVTKFMAAHIMAASIGDAFRRKAAVAVNAESSSGKSRLIMGLIGGSGFPRLHILSAGMGFANYSPAGIRQTIANKTRVLALDEFEDEGQNDRRSKVVAEVLDMLRDLTGEKNTMIQGSRSGEAVRYALNTFVFTAAIVLARKIQDANRFVTVQLQHTPGRDDPQLVIDRELGPGFIAKVKYDLDVGLMPYVAQVQQAYAGLEKQYSHTSARPPGVDTRYFENLQPALAIMKIAGRDYNKFVHDFCEAHKEGLSLGKTHSESGELFNTLVQSPQLTVRDPNTKELNHHSFLQLLASDANRMIINTLGSGLYFDVAQGLLVVNWTQAMQTILSKTVKYRNETNVYSLRELANRHPKALKAEELVQSGAIQRLRRCGVPAMAAHSLSAFRVMEWVKELNEENNIVETSIDSSTKKSETTDGRADYDFG